MSFGFARSDRSRLAQWWWTVDLWSLVAILCLVAFGALLMLSASSSAAERFGRGSFDFARQQFLVMPAALALVFALSLCSLKSIRRLAVAGLFAALLATAATLVVGAEVNGSSRWLRIFGQSLQPSEFVKPCFAVTVAWLLALAKIDARVPGQVVALALWLLAAALFLLQPDFGQTLLISAIFGAQLFVAGLPLVLVGALAGLGIAALVGGYLLFPHVQLRIDSFLDPAKGDRFQVDRAQEAFAAGGWLGRGPGEGLVKDKLPDPHTDFIFAVAGEEYGLLFCIILVALFAVVALRSLARAGQDNSLFVVLAITGLVTQFALQALINMASALHLVPTKGMTLPFLSYGGSSLLAMGLALGMVLALTRRRFGIGEIV